MVTCDQLKTLVASDGKMACKFDIDSQKQHSFTQQSTKFWWHYWSAMLQHKLSADLRSQNNYLSMATTFLYIACLIIFASLKGTCYEQPYLACPTDLPKPH